MRALESDTLNISMDVGIPSTTQSRTWTFPTVQYKDTARFDNLSPSATPYASRFPRATHAQRNVFAGSGITFTSYTYFRIANDSLILQGGASRVQGQGQDTTYFGFQNTFVAKFPFTLGYVFSRRDSISSFSGAYTISNVSETFDAFGSISTPLGTFQCLRNKEVTISESVFPGFPTRKDTLLSLSWITKEAFYFQVVPRQPLPSQGTIPIRYTSYAQIFNTPVSVPDASPTVPTTFELLQNYPNPFNPSTTIEYSLPQDGYVKLSVFNALGEEVAVLVNGENTRGHHKVVFDGTNLPSGVYLYRLSSGGNIKVGKMSLVK